MANKNGNKPFVRVRVEPDLLDAWQAVVEARRTSQQKALHALISWVVQQDPMLQAMLFGLVPDVDPDKLSRMAKKSIAKGK